MSFRTAAAVHLSVGARLSISRLLHGHLLWQRSLTRALRRIRSPRVPVGHRVAGTPGHPLWARVVDRFDSWAVRAETQEAVVAALVAAEIPLVIIDGGHTRARIVVPDVEALRLRAVLATLDGAEWCVATTPSPRSARRLATRAGQRSIDRAVSVFRALAASDGALLSGPAEAVDVELWSVVDNDRTPCPDGGTYEPGTLLAPRYNGVAAYLTPRAWERASRRSDRRALPSARITEVAEPIDIVYTWVDGTDPVWRERRDRAQAELHEGAVNPNAVSSSRFLGHDELRYSLRSVEMFASWVRRIHIVTAGQTPPWLDLSHPQIRVVDHAEIFRDRTALPVFNSHAIESQLHHIPGLADRYVYLNDDVFFGRPVAPELFFEGNGLSRFFVSRALIDLDPASVRDMPVMSAAKRNRELVENLSGRTITSKVKHTPHPQQRRVLEEIEERYPEIFKQLAGSRFRDPEDHSVASALHHWYAYATGRAVEGAIAYDYLDLASDEAVLTLNRISRARDFDVFCLNDTNLSVEDREAPSRMIQGMLRAYYPLRSAYELPGR
jgi:hypothetical protein